MYKYKLPNRDGTSSEHETDVNSLIIIGANGSGKSKLGAWIEQRDMENTHRVGAQRSLNFGEYIQLKSYEQAENYLFYGRPNKEPMKSYRWNNGEGYTTKLLDDYENILAALIAMKNNQNDTYIEECKKRDINGKQHDRVPETVIDKLQKIWKNVFPQRDIDFSDSKVKAILNINNERSISYKGNQMSDGERVGLYLIAQCLCIPENKTIIIDEPEIHLHKSIMNRLWNEIENYRPDCFFIYITHDTQFAANHGQSEKIWVKRFDGSSKWEYEKINGSELPEQLLLDIMGNRKKVLFVEGAENSYDTILYSKIYKNYYIVPYGSCSEVIARTKAMKNAPQLHDLDCYGIIDRDYRSEHEINSLKSNGIYTLQIAEVESLFLVEELLIIVNTIQGYTDNNVVNNIKDYIINNRFKNEINGQICESTVNEIKYQLIGKTISISNEEEAIRALQTIQKDILYDEIKTVQERKFNDALTSKDYKRILSVFNRKSLMNSIGHFWGINDKDYCRLIIRHLQGGDYAENIKDAIIPYLPREIPIA